jgi:hypothetical protein
MCAMVLGTDTLPRVAQAVLLACCLGNDGPLGFERMLEGSLTRAV